MEGLYHYQDHERVQLVQDGHPWPIMLDVALVLLAICIELNRATCPGIVRYNARNMTSVPCPTNAFSCTANDVRVDTVSATVLDGQLCQCNPGSCQYSYVDVLFVVYVEAIASTRYDVTVYLSNDGQTIAPPVSTDCLGWAAIPGEGIGYYTPPYCSHFGVFTNNDGDGCGDITKVQSPVFANITARVSCANVNVNGTLIVPAVITWEQGFASGCTVSSFGGTGSKCVSENVTFTDLLPPCQSKVCPANDQCSNYTCSVINGTAVCIQNVSVGKSCTDSLFCTTDSVCDVSGNCIGSEFLDCGIPLNPCQTLSCHETVNGSVCVSLPKPNGTSCSSGSVCKFGGTCQLGSCVESQIPCPSNTTCAGYACVDPGGCTIFPRTGIACGPSDACQSHICNELGLCVDTYAPSSVLCGSGETSCQFSSHCDGIGNCAVGDLKPNGTLCSECMGCLQAAYCTGVSPICPMAIVIPCPSINCSVGTCKTYGECGCDYSSVDCHDTNACTQDFCNASTGECYHPLLDCPPLDAYPNQCIQYSCNSESEEFPCVATPRSGERCEVDTNQCLYGVCVTGYNSTWCNENPFDPIPLPSPTSECCYYACDPGSGVYQLCNTSSPCNTGNQCYNYECTLNPNTTACGCTLVSEKPHPPDTDCVIYTCNPGVGWIPDYQNGLPCGSPTETVCDFPDTCLAGACQSNYANSSVECAGETLCKYPAYCTGTGSCLTQANKPDGLSCGPSHGECDQDDVCSVGICVRGYMPNGTVCGTTFECHVDNVCNEAGVCVPGAALPDGTSCGISGVCGSRNCSSGVCVNLLSSGNICNSSEFECQLDALCAGNNFFCPDRFPSEAGTLCRTGSGCTPSGFCDGTNFTCPVTAPISCDDGNACTLDSCVFNTSNGQSYCAYQNLSCYDSSLCTEYSCDPLIGCTGTAIHCNDNNSCTTAICVNGSGCQFLPLPASTICDDGDLCTENDTCGEYANCSGTPKCQPRQCEAVTCIAGDCVYSPANQSLNCTPEAAQTCPGNFMPCLAGYTCQGLACLPVYHPSTIVCRAAVGECDLPDYCSGSSACCPLDFKQTNGASCGSGEHICGADRCFAGVCIPVDLNTGQICNSSSNPCEEDAICQPGDFECPVKEPVVPCCLDNDECSSLEACETNLCVVQPQGCELSGCFHSVECLTGVCNESSKQCKYDYDDSYCEEDDFCMIYSCSPVILCLDGVNIGQLCIADVNCSRQAWTYTHWDCSLNFIEYPSLAFCLSACAFGVCSQEETFFPAINGTCGPPLQSGCLATPVFNCCHETLDCVDENLTDCVFQLCTDNQCSNYSVEPPACCQVDSDCGPAENCSYYNCTSNACVLTSVDCEASSSSSQLPESSETWFTVTLPGYFLLDPISLAFIPLLCLLGAIVAFRRHHHHHHNHRKGHQGH